MIDFPASPTTGQIYNGTNGVTYRWDGAIWVATGASAGGDFCANQLTGIAALPNNVWTTMVPDVVLTGNSGSYYSTATGRYTPPAGRYCIYATYTATAAVSTLLGIQIRKNGTGLVDNYTHMPSNGMWMTPAATLIVDANGTDWFDMQGISTTAATNAPDSLTFQAFPISGIKGPPGDPVVGPIRIGYATGVPVTTSGTVVTPAVQVASTAIDGYSTLRYGGGNAAAFTFGKSGNSTLGTQGLVGTGTGLGKISFNGSNGTSFIEGAYIEGAIDDTGTPGAASMPGRISIAVSPDGSATPVEALRIKNTGAATFSNDVSVRKLSVGTTVGSFRFETYESNWSTGYTETARIRVANNVGLTTHTQMMIQQNAVNVMNIEVSDQANVKGALWIQPYGGAVNLGAPLTGTTATFTGQVAAGGAGFGGNTTGTGFYNDGANVAVRGYATGGIHFQSASGGTSYGYCQASGWTFNGPVTATGTVFAPGAQIQMVSTQTGAMTSAAILIPADDTIPQNTEGSENLTLAITPKSATSTLYIEVTWNGAHSVVGVITAALFVDTAANALAAAHAPTIANGVANIRFTHVVASGSTAARTYRVRAGGSAAGTTTFNGASAARRYGGVMASSIVIQEVAP